MRDTHIQTGISHFVLVCKTFFNYVVKYNHMTQEQSLEACSDYYAERDKKDLEIHN